MSNNICIPNTKVFSSYVSSLLEFAMEYYWNGMEVLKYESTEKEGRWVGEKGFLPSYYEYFIVTMSILQGTTLHTTSSIRPYRSLLPTAYMPLLPFYICSFCVLHPKKVIFRPSLRNPIKVMEPEMTNDTCLMSYYI